MKLHEFLYKVFSKNTCVKVKFDNVVVSDSLFRIDEEWYEYDIEDVKTNGTNVVFILKGGE